MVFLAGTGKTRQSNICSRNNCCYGKAIGIQYSECMSVFLPKIFSKYSACAKLYCHACGLSSSTIFFHMVS